MEFEFFLLFFSYQPLSEVKREAHSIRSRPKCVFESEMFSSLLGRINHNICALLVIKGSFRIGPPDVTRSRCFP